MTSEPLSALCDRLTAERDDARAEAAAWKGHVEALNANVEWAVPSYSAWAAATAALSKPVCEDGTGRKPVDEGDDA